MVVSARDARGGGIEGAHVRLARPFVRDGHEQLLPAPGFRDAVRALEGAWRDVQDDTALALPKLQTAPSLHALLLQADALNDVLAVKLHALGAAHGGAFHRADVKAEARAFQKLNRTYHGEWRRLCDLCRGSLEFETVGAMEACLRAIGADAELQVVKAGDDKMRLREGFEGGYRDIQLCVRLDSAEARARGVHEHLAEVQLHLGAIAALKSDGGHANYVMCRNLAGG